MSNLNKQRLKEFAEDPIMSEAVYDVLLKTFMRKREGGMELKASQMLAIDMLQEAWEDMKRYKQENNKTHTPRQLGM